MLERFTGRRGQRSPSCARFPFALAFSFPGMGFEISIANCTPVELERPDAGPASLSARAGERRAKHPFSRRNC